MSTEGFSSNEEMMAAHHPDQAAPKTGSTAGSGPYQGYNTYEEMMAAHHGPQAAKGSEDGCGGVASGTGAKAEFAGTTSAYGITYDDAGYQTLLKAAKDVKLDTAGTNTIVDLDILLPCCGVKQLKASGNCECGHHIAMFGLAKTLAKQGYERAAIQDELNKWKQIFYPGGGSGDAGAC